MTATTQEYWIRPLLLGGLAVAGFLVAYVATRPTLEPRGRRRMRLPARRRRRGTPTKREPIRTRADRVAEAGRRRKAKLDSPSRPKRPPAWSGFPAASSRWGRTTPRPRPAEKPAHRVKVDGFWIDATEVTNAEFRKFVDATKYVTMAERPVDWEVMKTQVPPGTPKPPDEQLAPGSLVFTPAGRPGAAGQPRQLVELGDRRRLAASRRPRQLDRRQGRLPGGPGRRSTTPSPTRSGPASGCPPRPNGSAPRAGDLKARSTPGATSSTPTASGRPTPGRGAFP